MRTRPSRRAARTSVLAGFLVAAALTAAGCTPAGPDVTPTGTSTAPSAEVDAIAAAVEGQMTDLGLQAVLLRVQVGDDVVIDRAWGESMTGVPATTAMTFRNGAVAFAYMSTLLLQYVDDGTVSLDDTIDAWMPQLPASDAVTLRMLANQTTGYPDYEKSDAWMAAYNADPFHEWTTDERLDAAFSLPLEFDAGTNWSYSHTNFMILGMILAQIGDAPLDDLLAEHVLDPLGLEDTIASDTSAMPEPALHAYTGERRVAFGVPTGTDFVEDSTYWNPAWGTPPGAAEATTVADLVTSAIGVGTGTLLSDESYEAMTGPSLLGFGERQDACAPACFTQIDAYNYGLGVVRSGSWILQNPQLSGYSAVMAYLPEERIAIGVAATYTADAFNSDGTYANGADRVFRAVGAVVGDDAPPAAPPLAPRY